MASDNRLQGGNRSGFVGWWIEYPRVSYDSEELGQHEHRERPTA